MIYIASPYTSRCTGSRSRELEHLARALYSARYAASLIRAGHACFAPLAHGHSLRVAVQPMLDGSAAAWREINAVMMRASHTCHVLLLRGTDTSAGVAEEIDYFDRKHAPISFIPFDEQWCGPSWMADCLRPRADSALPGLYPQPVARMTQ